MKTEMQIGEWVSVPAFPAFYKEFSNIRFHLQYNEE